MDAREKILAYIKLHGPTLPIKISKELNTNLIIASAYLSEAVEKQMLKISHVKVGNSQLYYMPGQEEMLQAYSVNLHEKEIKSYNLLKESKILRDDSLEPIIRVTLRNIPDYAKPIEAKFNDKIILFWKWYLLSNEETQDLIHKLLIPPEKEILQQQKTEEIHSKPIAEKPGTQTITEQKKLDASVEKQEEKTGERPHKESHSKKQSRQATIIPSQETIMPLEKPSPISDEFYSEVKSYFETNNIKIISLNLIRKNAELDFIVEIASPVGSLKYYGKAKSKKSINEGDLSSLFIESQSKKMPPLLIIKGELTKKAKEFFEKEFKAMAIKRYNMGIAFKDIISGEKVKIEDLKNKVLVVDSFNLLYQFLTTIRSRDGSSLSDSNGNVTSHLVGLFSRTTSLMEKGVKLAFVFDGKPPALKHLESQRRAALKEQALEKYKKAVSEEDLEGMKKFAGRTAKLEKGMVDEAKELLIALGLPVIQAPSEGEAQAAYIVKKGDAYASVSQDYDSLLHGTPRLVRNLSIAGKRKQANKLSYDIIEPEMIELHKQLQNLSLDIDQLTVLAIIIGTDYNIGGIKGIGPKKGLKLLQSHGKDFDKIFEELKWNGSFDYSWHDVFDTIKKMPTTDNYSLKISKINESKVHDLLVNKHDFSEERVQNTLQKLQDFKKDTSQQALNHFFG